MRWVSPARRAAGLMALGFLIWTPLPAPAQDVTGATAPVEGLRENTPGVHALVGARVVVGPGLQAREATIVMRDGIIEAVGPELEPPPDARVHHLDGRWIYPAFIDAHSRLGAEGAHAREEEERGTHWNPQVRSFVSASAAYMHDEEMASRLRSQGIGVVRTVPRVGIFRGRAALVSLGKGPDSRRLLVSEPAQTAAFPRSDEVDEGYPSSLMGSMALIRQALLDAAWYQEAHRIHQADPGAAPRPETNHALAELGGVARGEEPLIVETRNEDELLWALALGEEFDLELSLRGSGFEYRILDVLGRIEVPLILPVDFPAPPDVSTPEAALNRSVEELRHWYLAPENPARLAGAGIEFAFTADGLEDPTRFLERVRGAVARGLDPDVALAALTTVPARMVGVEATLGTLEAGKAANLIVAGSDLFQEGTPIQEVWLDGTAFPVDPEPTADVRGEWLVRSPAGPQGPVEGRLFLEGDNLDPEARLVLAGQGVEVASVSFRPGSRRLRMSLDGRALDLPGEVFLSASLGADELHGWGELPDGTRIGWEGTRVSSFPTDPDPSREASSTTGAAAGTGSSASTDALDLPDLRPALDFGAEAIPEQPERLLVRGGTVWTMGPQGVLENADVLVERGRIVAVGRDLPVPDGVEVVDADGRHVTPGLIDAHIHSGSGGGINEVGSAIVPEVRLGDVITANNPWMYRQLAGGLTTAHLMHGSANPIGGQNVHMKMRWGTLPSEQRLEGAPRTVKFALGENVKRRTERYPDTRMGTEQIIRDHFKAAREYEARWAEWEAAGQGIPPRRDLRMEALVDILNGDILVQAHSYRQDEILMLMRLAEEFDLTIKAFHHGVEAYKVAPELRAHGAGAVVWSDWGGFKIEAYDATLYNARLLHESGVLTSLHSDNSEIAARMNWEAGKMVRAGLSGEDALAMVTINTAALLGIDDRVGSLEEGKDADLVIWSENPLSQFTRVEQTWIDGRRYFDRTEDERLRGRVESERARLLQVLRNER
jgi:imidazolonepropionase-like amidohydrolase